MAISEEKKFSKSGNFGSFFFTKNHLYESQRIICMSHKKKSPPTKHTMQDE
jgi:hypothetical protein